MAAIGNPIAGLVPDPEPERETGMLDLPESCILVIFSLTMPCDIGRLSVVCKLFNSVAYSGDLWNKSLLKICHQIVSRADPPVPASMVKLCARLVDPILIDGGTKVFIYHLFSGFWLSYLGKRRSSTH